MEIAPRISVDEKISFGKPVITGTRVSVDLIIGKLAGGMTYEEVIAGYEITHEDILAVLDYAAKTLASEEIKAVG
jgi:uncharacterized protein (DUF433 family)